MSSLSNSYVLRFLIEIGGSKSHAETIAAPYRVGGDWRYLKGYFVISSVSTRDQRVLCMHT